MSENGHENDEDGRAGFNWHEDGAQTMSRAEFPTGFAWAAKLNAESPPRPCWVQSCGSPRSGMQHLWEAHPEIYSAVNAKRLGGGPDA